MEYYVNIMWMTLNKCFKILKTTSNPSELIILNYNIMLF